MKNIILVFLVAIATLFAGLAYQKPSAMAINCDNPQSAKEQIQCGTCDAAGTNDAQGKPVCDASSSPTNVSSTITTVINLLSAVAGVAGVIMIIIAGLRYVTSGGKEEGVKNAKNTILYAVIGLVIVALAQLIVHFVLNNTTKATNGTAPSSKSTTSSSSSSSSSSSGDSSGTSSIPQ